MAKPTVSEASAFPTALHPVLYTPPDTKVTNAVIFFPGLGDSSHNFSAFARALNLPDTLCITLQPPSPLPLPLPEGFHWGDDIIFDQSSGSLDPDAGFTKSSKLIAEDVIKNLLIEQHGYSPRQILLFGYGQGGMAALATVLHSSISSLSLGGIISIGSTLPSASMLVNGPKNKTPVLLLGGSKGALMVDGRNGVKKVQSSFEFVESHRWLKADDSMPKTRDEAMPMMQFLARRLQSRRGVPEGAVEIS